MAASDISIYNGTKYPPVFKPDYAARVSLCDITDDRILDYLNTTVKEEHFAEMASWGVKLVRIPTGYWNWIDLPEGVTPNATATV
jgi:hypothetical protein